VRRTKRRKLVELDIRLQKKVAKKAVAVAKSMAYDRLYHKLGMKEGEKGVFKLARAEKEKQGIWVL